MPKIILITHQKGGVGKSTLAFNMASILKDSVNTAIIDLDLQGSLYKSRNSSSVPIYPPNKLEDINNMDYDFIFIDTPPYLISDLPMLCRIANVIVIPTKTGLYDLLAIEDTIEIVKSAKKEKDTLIVFNMVKPNTTLTNEMNEALERFNVSVSNTFISDLVAFTRSAINDGIEENTKAQNQIIELTKEVLSKIS
ncbi:chromosome partitioning protein [Sphingobacterium alimentarium]|uniref:Chromosome partitioning protein n=1 Tax=Sphingobacterium alimentarium TaxID=797292 RepID=A0A4R3VJH8_9SPHI|nr:ParA family protein [Sphingobacterium alimentarium]TCV06053.1 chromosome partitioning protein [Sphingobacterium alimentarium]